MKDYSYKKIPFFFTVKPIDEGLQYGFGRGFINIIESEPVDISDKLPIDTIKDLDYYLNKKIREKKERVIYGIHSREIKKEK